MDLIGFSMGPSIEMHKKKYELNSFLLVKTEFTENLKGLQASVVQKI